MKQKFLVIIFLLATLPGIAQLQSPEQFLGYKVGERFTPHQQVVNYFRHVAQNVPAKVKMEKYGETNEHRPLYLSFISSEENITNLEQIRMNNLRLAHLTRDKMAPTENTPVIVWLSYGVHGNESASCEAALLTLYALVDPENNDTKEWLKNTVVIMDPSLNPDGRERYTSWYQSVVGNPYNPSPIAREHNEPWPGGRSNHYNFDLNRDWAWQTQVESRQRVAQYNKWLPQVHVDFHEQGIEEPYYFAPAAEPYHEVITPWQRDFQETIGRNHAKYFDQNGWLYFTKERFDLFYPSYGDTYPIYNGAIGMTYEQGGSGAAGLGVLTSEGDTLTLIDRALHHHTTGLSTIEVSSENAKKLISEFHQFYNDGVSGKIGEYKTFIIKNKPGDADEIKSLIKLLDNNEIHYGVASGNAKGYRYQTGEEENFSISSNDLVISAFQPKSAMVKVLFEPKSKLSDSVTYDITAWSLPYAYGLDAFAVKEKIDAGGGKIIPDFEKNIAADPYGYVIRWQGVSSASAVAQLLEKGVRLRFSHSPFQIKDVKFDRGSIIVMRNGNKPFGKTLWKTVSDICNANEVTMIPVQTAMVDKGYDFGSDIVHPMKAVKVAMLTGEGVSSLGAGEIWDFFDNTLRYKLTLINANDVAEINWSEIDVLIMPQGRYRFLEDKELAGRFENWIENGGRVVALENAVSQLAQQKWSLLDKKSDSSQTDADKEKEAKKSKPYELLKPYENREREWISKGNPGAIYKVTVDNTHPLMFGYPDYYYTLKMDNNVYNFIDEGGWNVGVLKKENKISGYVGHDINPKLMDGLLFGVQDLGGGTITYLADDVVFRNFWENGKLILCNAVFLVGQ